MSPERAAGSPARRTSLAHWDLGRFLLRPMPGDQGCGLVCMAAPRLPPFAMSSSSPPPAPPLAPDLTRKTKSNSLHALLWLPSRQGLSRHGSVWGGKTLCFRVSPRENKGSPAWQQPPRRPGPGLDLVQHHSPASGPCPPSILSTVFLSLDQNQHLGQSSS